MDEAFKLKLFSLINQYLRHNDQKRQWNPKKDWVQYSGPFFDSQEILSIIESALNGWLCLGSKANEFEKSFPPLLGKKFGVVTNSGSSGNLLMIATAKEYFRFKNGTKIITPVAGFPTTLNPIIQNNLTPVFVDIELDSLNINIDNFLEVLNSEVLAVMFAHALGNPPNMDKIMEIVNGAKLILLEDCCDALGSTYDERPLGSDGEMATCSFYPAHHMTTMGEGGFLSCRNDDQERIARSFRDWGRGCHCHGKKAGLSEKGLCGKRFSNWLPNFSDAIVDHKYVYDRIGYNLKPIELQCAVGLAQIKKLPIIHQLRRNNYKRLMRIFEPYEEFFILPRAREKANPSWFAFPLTIRDKVLFKRIDFTSFLENHKIQTRNYFGGNLLLQPAYKGLYQGDAFHDFPNATKTTFDTFFLGTSPVISLDQLNYIEEIVKLFFKKI